MFRKTNQTGYKIDPAWNKLNEFMSIYISQCETEFVPEDAENP